MIVLSHHLPEGFQSFICDVCITFKVYLMNFHFLLFVWGFLEQISNMMRKTIEITTEEHAYLSEKCLYVKICCLI